MRSSNEAPRRGGAEADVRPESVLRGAMLEVGEDLLLGREETAPVRIGLERIRIEVRRDVAGDPPRYVLSRQVPPTRSARSMIVKSSIPACFSRIAMPSPARPAPMISTWSFGRATAPLERGFELASRFSVTTFMAMQRTVALIER